MFQPKAEDIIPYLRNRNTAHRVVGYIAFQVLLLQGNTLVDLVGELVTVQAHIG